MANGSSSTFKTTDSILATADDLIVSAGPKKGWEFGKLDIDYLKKVVQRNPGDDRLKSYARAKVALAEVRDIKGLTTADDIVDGDAQPVPESKAVDTFIPLKKTNGKIEPAPGPGRMGVSGREWLAWLRAQLARVDLRFLYILFVLWTFMVFKPTLAAVIGKYFAQVLESGISTFTVGFNSFVDELWNELNENPARTFAANIKHELEQTTLPSNANVNIVVETPRHGLLHMLTLLSDHFMSAVIGMLVSLFVRTRGAGA